MNAQIIEDILNQAKIDKNGRIKNKGRLNDMLHSEHLKAVKNCSIQNVSGWLSFDTPPKAGQEILIVWETYPPEKRILTDEDLARNWDGIRWLPIPAYR